MQLDHTLCAIPLSANHHKVCLYRLTKKIGYLSLVALSINSALAFESIDITLPLSLQYPSRESYSCLVKPTTEAGCPGNINLTTVPTPRTFDYDPSMLPEVAEVIFALRIKHANIGELFIVNLSGNYLLELTKNKIKVLDTYTKKNHVYHYQSANPNITIGLGVSKGLPANYKSIIIKEDANGKLYDYAALHSDNITTDETMLIETLNHPFYEIAGKDGVEKKVKVTKAMAFYDKALSHSRLARCVKSSTSIFSQLQEILADSLVCGPKADLDILTASHEPVENMKLDQQLVAAAFDKEKHYSIGHRLLLSVHDGNAVALLTSSLECDVSIMKTIKDRRHKRAPRKQDKQECSQWTHRIVELFMSLKLDYNQVRQIVRSILTRNGIVAGHFLNDTYSTGSDQDIDEFASIVRRHRKDAVRILQQGLAQAAQAGLADSGFLSAGTRNVTGASGVGASGVEGVLEAVADGFVAVYALTEEQFKALPNVVKVVADNGQTQVVNGAKYTTHTVRATRMNQADLERIKTYLQNVLDWETTLLHMMQNATGLDETRILLAIPILQDVKAKLAFIQHPQPLLLEQKKDLLVSTVHHNGVLIGISIGTINNGDYLPTTRLLSPESITISPGGYVGAIAYLESEVVGELFSDNEIETASLQMITRDGSPQIADVIFTTVTHDEL